MKKIMAILLALVLALSTASSVFALPGSFFPVDATVNDVNAVEQAQAISKTIDGENRDVEYFPTKDAVELFGFSHYYYGGAMATWYGFVRMMSDDPENCTFISEYYDYVFTAGDYVDDTGLIYASKQEGNPLAGNNINTFVSINPTTFEETVIANWGEGNSYFAFTEMAYDYSTSTMFGFAESILYTVDLTTGEYEIVGPTMAELYGLACSDDGVIYGVDINGILCTIDKETASVTIVGDTGVTVNYLQSMTWDHINGGLYWANCNQNDGILYSVDPQTGAATALGNIYNADMELTCLYTLKEQSTETVAVTGVTLTPESESIMEQETLELTARVLPWNATNQTIVFASSDDSIATVDNTGLVTGVSAGEATITVTTEDGSYTASSVITVFNEEALQAAFNVALNAQNATNNFVNDATYPWEIIRTEDRTYVQSITSGINNSSASITLEDISMHRGNSVSFDWFVSSEANFDMLTFNANGERCAAVSGITMTDFQSYTWYAPADGVYDLTWTYAKNGYDRRGDDLARLDNVSLDLAEPGPVTGITLTPEAAEIYEGHTVQLNAFVNPPAAINNNVSFSSSDEEIAIVDENGFVTGVGGGQAIIFVTTEDGGYTDSSLITVIPMAELNAILSEALNVEGGTLAFTNDTQYPWESDVTTFEGRNVARSTNQGHHSTDAIATLVAETDGTKLLSFDWMVNCETRFDKLIFAIDGVTVQEVTGRMQSTLTTVSVLAGEAGTHTYTWTYRKDSAGSGGQDTAWLDNIAFTEAPEPESVQMRETSRIHIGQSYILTANVLPAVATDLTLSFSTSDSTIATVDAQTGLVTGVSVGTATITATAVNGVSADCVLTVTDERPEADGLYYGFVSSASGVTSSSRYFTKLDPVNEIATTLYTLPQPAYAMEYCNGVIYAYLTNTNSFIAIDPVTNELLSASTVPEIGFDMTYDYTTGTMYALSGGQFRKLCVVDLTTGRFTPVAEISGAADVVMTLACDNLGVLYAIDVTGTLYTIDKATAIATSIGDTGVGTIGYVQSMDYDYLNDSLVWASYVPSNLPGVENTSVMYTVDRSTAAVSPLFSGRNVGEICGLLTFDQPTTVVRPMGDANNDGVLNTGDAAYLLRSFIGLNELTEADLPYCDVNGDGNVNTGDAAMVLEMCLN